ncbi:unnamed protein product [Caretta caretta]
MRSGGGEGITGLAAAGGGSVGGFGTKRRKRLRTLQGAQSGQAAWGAGKGKMINDRKRDVISDVGNITEKFDEGKKLQESQLSSVAVVGGKWKNPVTATRVLENADIRGRRTNVYHKTKV